MIDADLITRDQLGHVVDALESALVTRKDLGAFADLVEQALPALIAKSASVQKCFAPIGFRLIIFRDEITGLMSEIVVAPLDGVPQ